MPMAPSISCAAKPTATNRASSSDMRLPGKPSASPRENAACPDVPIRLTTRNLHQPTGEHAHAGWRDDTW
jgi:hypothetical protein